MIQANPSTTLTPELLADLLDPALSPFDICHAHALSLDQLATIADSPPMAHATARLETIQAARARAQRPALRQLALDTLARVAAQEPATPPHAETVRKAAAALARATAEPAPEPPAPADPPPRQPPPPPEHDPASPPRFVRASITTVHPPAQDTGRAGADRKILPMERSEIFDKVKEVLVDALAVDDDEVTPQATLIGDLGAESIDILDISFQLEKAFGFKIAQGELFPEGVTQDPQFVQDGKLTPKGIEQLKQRLPHFDFAALQADPSVANIRKIFTVDALVNFCEQKLQTA